jgi:hypothetical protein
LPIFAPFLQTLIVTRAFAVEGYAAKGGDDSFAFHQQRHWGKTAFRYVIALSFSSCGPAIAASGNHFPQCRNERCRLFAFVDGDAEPDRYDPQDRVAK